MVKVSGVILAGGKSRRLGQDKAHLVFRGRSILHHQVELLRILGVREIIVAAGRLRPLPLPRGVVVVEDRYPGFGPLAGIHAGLLAAKNPLSLVLACDMPFLAPPLARELLDLGEEKVKVCVRAGFLEPFPGAYAKEIIPALEAHLAAGKRGVQEFIRSVPHAVISEERVLLLDPTGRSFVNINTPEALACAGSE